MMTRSFPPALALFAMLGASQPAAGALPSTPAAPIVALAETDTESIAVETLQLAIELRFANCCAEAFEPSGGPLPIAAIIARLDTLHELVAFARSTGRGLVAAEQDLAGRARLAPAVETILIATEERAQGSVFALLENPEISGQGWFLISRFGQAVESRAADLIVHTDANREEIERLSRRLAGLVAAGEASGSTARRIASLTRSNRMALK